MEKRKSCRCDCPIRDLLELPKEGYTCKEHVNIIVDPIVSLHERVSTFVSIETVLDL